jgi:hypothetical protein
LYGDRQLTVDEAVSKYREAKENNPRAFVVLDDLENGKWVVRIHRSEREKSNMLLKRLEKMIDDYLKVVTRNER